MAGKFAPLASHCTTLHDIIAVTGDLQEALSHFDQMDIRQCHVREMFLGDVCVRVATHD